MLPVVKYPFTLKTLNLEQVSEPILSFNEIAYKLRDVSDLVCLQVVLLEKSEQILSHLICLRLSSRPATHHR